jgi:hypothetical protein
MKKFIILILCITCFFEADSQIVAINNPIFQGGNQDGNDIINYSQSVNNIYSGGFGDGANTLSFMQNANNIFIGGNGDGWNSTSFIQSINNIFAGGNGDGWNNTNFLQTGNDIFSGGNGDGWSKTLTLQAGNNIYAGGIGDGWNAIYYKPIVALPVRIIYFKAEKLDAISAKISWETASEQNSNYFDVERGTNALQYKVIGKIAAIQNSNERLSYSFTDNSPEKGINYYRLKQVDLDGKYTYTPARALNFESINTETVKYYPNPTEGILNIEIQALAKELIIFNLFNTAGIVVNHFKIESIGQNLIQVNMGTLPKGIYFVHLKSNSLNSTHRVVLN